MQGKVHRKKVTFAWNDDDVNKVFASMFASPGENYKFIDLPLSNYASSSFDSITSGGKVIGASMFSGYSFNERKMLSLGFVEEQYAKPGTQLTLVWGEENGGTKKNTVERHKQTELRVEVGPTPYGQQARETYHQGWRTAATG
jgi:vanillate/3-O-methylgallate O-demethylase